MTNSMANSRTILVVDDEPAIGEILTLFLGGHNFRVLYFAGASAALDCLSENARSQACLSRRACSEPFGNTQGKLSESGGKPDCGLLLTDLDMPGINGLELVRRAKSLYPALPVIVMSGSADGQAREEIFKLGADFIPKPFDLDDLLNRINSASPPKAGPCPPIGGRGAAGGKGGEPQISQILGTGL